MTNVSYVYWYPEQERHSCGYCKNERGNISHGMWARSLTVEDYQNLIDRGWRRSGNYCYKPIMDQICCPMYTIRCDVMEFVLSKSQKKTMKKFNKFIRNGDLNKSEDIQEQHSDLSVNISNNFMKEAPICLTENLPEELNTAISEFEYDEVDGFHKSQAGNSACGIVDGSQSLAQTKSGKGADPNKPPCRKAKFLRMERKKEKLLKRGMSVEKITPINEQKKLEQFLNEVSNDSKHNFKLELISTSSCATEWDNLKKREFELFNKYQMKIHNDPPGKCTMESFSRFLVNSPLQITLERLHEQHKHFKLSAELFSKYQIAIHNDKPSECRENHYKDFLIETPLQYVRFSNDSELGFGSFHQLYWLDDKLIAVGVIDILPKCVSAVYFFYDPDYRSLTLGTYGSLREVEFTRSLHKKIPSIRYYYMGFYIHSCQKMRYKGKLTPSFLLCPETYSWVPIEKSLLRLEVCKYSRLAEDVKSRDENDCNSQQIDQIKIWCNRKIMFFKQYKLLYGQQDTIQTIARLVGRQCAKSIIFIIDT